MNEQMTSIELCAVTSAHDNSTAAGEIKHHSIIPRNVCDLYIDASFLHMQKSQKANYIIETLDLTVVSISSYS